MICDYQTNKVYLAEGIKHYETVAHNLLLALYNEGIETEFLRRTESWKHIWVRDYMPIQLTKTRFLLYRYAPDYLKGYEDYIPPYQTICRGLRLKGKETPFVIDGGNVVKFSNCVVMTDKVLKENPGYTEGYIRKQLEEAFGCEVVLIPWDRYEMFGHADGMMRAIGDYYILMNNYCDFDKDLQKRLKDALSGRFSIAELHYDVPRPSRLSWAYLNFLQVNNCIFVPGLGVREDEKAMEQIQEYYPHHKVILIPGCQELVREGGALNCISWNIVSKKKRIIGIMSRIKTTEELYQTMRLDGKESVENLERAFADIADALINDFAILKNKKIYHFVEMEFYHNLIDDTIVYPRKADALHYFFHKSGMDLTFLSDENRFGGILVRAIRCGNEFINGPYKVVDTLFDIFDARKLPERNYPIIVPKEEVNRITPVQSRRFHIESDKQYRFSLPQELWVEHKGYQAYPWDYNGNLKK